MQSQLQQRPTWTTCVGNIVIRMVLLWREAIGRIEEWNHHSQNVRGEIYARWTYYEKFTIWFKCSGYINYAWNFNILIAYTTRSFTHHKLLVSACWGYHTLPMIWLYSQQKSLPVNHHVTLVMHICSLNNLTVTAHFSHSSIDSDSNGFWRYRQTLSV